MRSKGKPATITALLIVLCLLLISTPSLAQEFPKRPINMLVAVAPGSPQDVLTRVLLSKAKKHLGQPFIVGNNGTGGGSVALGIVAKERADGYHLVCNGTPMVVMVPQIRPVAYKLADFVPVMQFGGLQYGLAVRADSGWKTLREFVAYAKKNPGKVSYGSMEVGTFLHMAMEFIARQEGIQWTHVPYPGGGQATSALLGGHIEAESGASSLFPHVRAGTLRLLVTYGERRTKSFPEVPTLRESGYDFRLGNAYMIAAPKGTPPAIIKKLDEAFRMAMDEPEFLQAAEKFELDVRYRDAGSLKKYLEETYVTYGRMIKEFNIPKEAQKKG